jgi:hypothetical protein
MFSGSSFSMTPTLLTCDKNRGPQLNDYSYTPKPYPTPVFSEPPKMEKLPPPPPPMFVRENVRKAGVLDKIFGTSSDIYLEFNPKYDKPRH